MFIVQNYTDKADGDNANDGDNGKCVIFLVSLSSRWAQIHLGRKIKLINYKKQF